MTFVFICFAFIPFQPRGRGLITGEWNFPNVLPRRVCNIASNPGLNPTVTTYHLPSLLLTDWLVWLTEADTVAHGDQVEAEWMRRVAAGDETALQQLFDRWKRPLLSFFYRSLGSHADAEDLTLEVLVRLHRSAPDYQPTAKFTTYLFHIAQNLLRNELRHRRRKPADAVPPELLEELPQPHDADRGLAELEEVLQQALARLPEKQRTALLLIQQQQLDYPAAAAALRMTENALRVLVHRARQMLKIEMEALP